MNNVVDLKDRIAHKWAAYNSGICIIGHAIDDLDKFRDVKEIADILVHLERAFAILDENR